MFESWVAERKPGLGANLVLEESKTNQFRTELTIAESNGRPEWTRTIDLFRVKEAL